MQKYTPPEDLTYGGSGSLSDAGQRAAIEKAYNDHLGEERDQIAEVFHESRLEDKFEVDPKDVTRDLTEIEIKLLESWKVSSAAAGATPENCEITAMIHKILEEGKVQPNLMKSLRRSHKRVTKASNELEKNPRRYAISQISAGTQILIMLSDEINRLYQTCKTNQQASDILTANSPTLLEAVNKWGVFFEEQADKALSLRKRALKLTDRGSILKSEVVVEVNDWVEELHDITLQNGEELFTIKKQILEILVLGEKNV